MFHGGPVTALPERGGKAYNQEYRVHNARKRQGNIPKRIIRRYVKSAKTWKVDAHKEVWFRGEGKKHEKSFLRLKLYRPPNGRAMKSISELPENRK